MKYKVIATVDGDSFPIYECSTQDYAIKYLDGIVALKARVDSLRVIYGEETIAYWKKH